jgi:hypothetical protein
VFKAVAAGNVHALGLRLNGTVTGWGTKNDKALQPPPRVSFKAVSAG